MKTINIRLSPEGIASAISQLVKYQDSIQEKTAELVDHLTEYGKAEAKTAFGGAATVSSMSEDGYGIIEAVGESIVIMEFGAGLATMESHPLAGNSPYTVEQWEYSRTVGSGEGALTGRWHFGGIPYDRVEPRHGMLDAHDYIVNNVEFAARKVFG